MSQDNTVTMASDEQPCLLLDKIPREVRNIIYEHLFVDGLVQLTKPDRPLENTVHLVNAPTFNVFLVCKQIHDEYEDVCFKNATIFIYASELDLQYSTFKFKRGVTKSLFQNVSQCHLKVPFGLLQEVGGEEEKFGDFIQTVVGGESEEDTYEREWTPSKDAVGRMSEMVKHLARWVKKDQASVFIDIVVHDDIGNFEDWIYLRLIQAPTFSEFICDSSLPFAAVRKLELCFSIDVALSSEIRAWDIEPEEPEDGGQDTASDDVNKETIKRETDDGILYETADSKQKCTWFLLPKCRSHAAGGLSDFRPIFNGLSQCTCCNHH
ncbi:hypothetical protein PRZ48_009672 [Zasmidium cellare]|uniref:Uncharacterized protein n=1 Tax=Zasmidium cellare TaxID=395010 RepID=A0ABR0ECC5_ZASCE|nr:hypothetical protein PRZ48_009672 [Zasmidium cellare]